MNKDWPAPFGGITTGTVFSNHTHLRAALTFMADGCGRHHFHNIAVQFDGRVIWTSDLGAECFERWQAQQQAIATIHRQDQS